MAPTMGFLVFLTILLAEVWAKPFFYNVPEAISSLVASASAASSQTDNGNLVDYRKQSKLKEDDDFFKESQENETDEPNRPITEFLSKKIGKVLQKIQFLSTLGDATTPKNSDDDFQKEFDDFDKEFEEVEGNNSSSVKAGAGYIYAKPAKPEKQVSASSGFKFNPGDIGVFFMELIGSLVGIAYGAAAQINYAPTTTAPPTN